MLGILLVVALPFVVVALKGERWRRAAGAAAVALAVLLVAHAVRDRRWHETSTRLGGDVAGVEQVIRFSPEALGRLKSAPEAFVLFDLTVPRGDLQDAEIEIGARRWPGGALRPCRGCASPRPRADGIGAAIPSGGRCASTPPPCPRTRESPCASA
jgi:hypothetical protein